MAKRRTPKTVTTIRHTDSSRKNIPTAEYQAVMADDERRPIQIAYKRRNRDLDPQLVWRGKDEQDWSDLVVQAPPLYIQEKVHPKVLIDDLMRVGATQASPQTDLFADFNGLPSDDAKTEFYQHDANWSNRMILGDSLQVMASLAEREGLRGKVQCIYIDPPYGIKFNSNFQWSTTSRDVRDGKAEHITREPEQVKAFRDTWRDGIHSYLTYLRDRLTVARDLLTESGSVFVQIGDENVHRVRALMDEVFGEENFIGQITFQTKIALRAGYLAGVADYILWYGKGHDVGRTKFRKLYEAQTIQDSPQFSYFQGSDGSIFSSNQIPKPDDEAANFRAFSSLDLGSSGRTPSCVYNFIWRGTTYRPPTTKSWKTTLDGMSRLALADRLYGTKSALRYKLFLEDYPVKERTNIWTDSVGVAGRTYIVQTDTKVIQRCILMTTDPGDLVLDPTCGSGTTAYVAEQWGRRWITIDTSRVALALARARIMGARYPYYLLSDSIEGQLKEAEIERRAPSDAPTYNDIRQGFVYERVPHITLGAIANNAEIDVTWEDFQKKLEPLREKLNSMLGTTWEEWEIPREAGDPWPEPAAKALQRFQQTKTDRTKASALAAINSALGRAYTLDDVPDTPFDPWTNAEAIECHRQWWRQRIARQKEIDASIAAKADYEYLYDKPYEDRNKVRVAGPFTVDSLSPHRLLGVDENDELIDNVAESKLGYGDKFDRSSNQDFATMILEHLKTSGVQQAHKEDKIMFSGTRPWPGDLVSALKGPILRVTRIPGSKNALAFSSARNLARLHVLISCKQHARPQMPTLMFWSPVPSTTKPTPRSSTSSVAFPSSRRG